VSVRAECAPLGLGPAVRAPDASNEDANHDASNEHIWEQHAGRERPPALPASRSAVDADQRSSVSMFVAHAPSARWRLRSGGSAVFPSPFYTSQQKKNVFRSLSTHRRSPYHLCLIPPRRRLRRFPHSRPPLHTACARRRRQILSTRSLLRLLSALPWCHEQSISSRYLLIVIPSAVDQQVSTAHRDTACA
jgi:hypothetical protein